MSVSKPVPVRDIRFRLAEAALECSHVSNRNAILIEPISVAGYDLGSLMMGMEIDVLRGPQLPCAEFPPLLLVCATSLVRPATQQRLSLSREYHPQSIVCAITGALEEPERIKREQHTQYEDARACLSAAGIGFLAEDEV